jgi:hypothetical protein
MGAPCAPGLIDCPSVLEKTLARSRRRWQAWQAAMLLALAAGCSSAPLAGKSCPCAAGYTCCDASMTCLADIAQCVTPPPPPCSSKRPSSLFVTGNGLPPPSHDLSDAGLPELKFGAAPEQWVSYSFQGTEPMPTVEATPDGNGIHVVATFEGHVTSALGYEGAGLSFGGVDCIDGTALTGVQFDFDGDLGGRQLEVGITSSDDIDVKYLHGTCTAGDMKCYGPTIPMDPTPGTNSVLFTALTTGGAPAATLDTSRIVNVQWELHDAKNPIADFTITNVTFF